MLTLRLMPLVGVELLTVGLVRAIAHRPIWFLNWERIFRHQVAAADFLTADFYAEAFSRAQQVDGRISLDSSARSRSRLIVISKCFWDI